MKKTLLNVLAALALVSPAVAGTEMAPAAAAPAPSVDLFRAHELNLDLYGAYSIASGGNDRDGFGGGLSLGYYFTRVVGLRLDATIVEAGGGTGLIGGDLLLRAPIDSAHIAPYGLVGAGAEVGDGDADLYLRAGAGLEVRFNEKVGVFVEGSYNWVDASSDRVLVKTGVRFAF